MKHFILALLVGLSFGVAGCGSSAKTTNVGENADAKAMADYEAAMAADQKANDEANKSAGN